MDKNLDLKIITFISLMICTIDTLRNGLKPISFIVFLLFALYVIWDMIATVKYL